MAFKNKQTGYYNCEPVLPGFGQFPRISLGTKRKADADKLEAAIKELARRALFEPQFRVILEALKPRGRGRPGQITPADVMVASHEPDGFFRLVRHLNDPLLGEVVEAYKATGLPGREELVALPNLVKYAGAKLPFSELCQASAIERLLREIERGEEKLRNSVIRYELRALSKLIRWKLGKAERDRVFAEVNFPAEDDRRKLRSTVVTLEAVGKLLDELDKGYQKPHDECARLYVEIAIRTCAEIRPLSETPNRNVRTEVRTDGEWGVIYLEGTKKIKQGTSNRDRYLRVPPHLFTRIKRYWRPDEPEALCFPLEYSRFTTIFMKARKRAGLMKAATNDTPLRPHDCRRIFGLLAERAQLERSRVSQAGYGHTRMAQTDDYLRWETALEFEDMERIEEVLKGATLMDPSAPRPTGSD